MKCSKDRIKEAISRTHGIAIEEKRELERVRERRLERESSKREMNSVRLSVLNTVHIYIFVTRVARIKGRVLTNGQD